MREIDTLKITKEEEIALRKLLELFRKNETKDILETLDKQQKTIEELAMLLRMVLMQTNSERKALDYLARNGLNNPLRQG